MGYKLVVVDTETGGLDSETKSILSLGAVIVEDGIIIDEFYMVIREDEILVDEKALRINGFTKQKIVAVGESPETVVEHFIDFLRKHNLTKKATIAGHNVEFDIGFIKRLFRLAERESDYGKYFSHRTIDTQATARVLTLAERITTKSTSLDSLCQILGVNVRKGKIHNALEDAKATAILLTGFIDMIKPRKRVPDAWD